MGYPLGILCFGNIDGVIHHLYTRHVPEGSNLTEGGARLSKVSSIDSCGYPAGYNITSRGCTEKSECKVELVRMSSPRLGARWRTTT